MRCSGSATTCHCWDTPKLILKSDGESAIMALKEAVQAESSMRIEVSGRSGADSSRILKEESPAYDSRSNGVIESRIRQVQGLIRALKDALESRIGSKIKEDHICLPWLIRHAGFLRSRLKVDSSGRAAHEKLKGKRSRRH